MNGEKRKRDAAKLCTEEGMAKCAEAAELIRTAFSWGMTKEGHEYWDALHLRLLKLSRGRRFEKVVVKR